MKERFNTEEWAQLQRIPIHMFSFVALADEELQSEEVAAFVTELGDALLYKDPLHSELFADLTRGDNFDVAFETAMKVGSGGSAGLKEELRAARTVLEEKLTSEEYNRFFASLTGVGIKVGAAAGQRRKPFSPEERMALAVFMAEFDVDLEAGQKAVEKL